MSCKMKLALVGQNEEFVNLRYSCGRDFLRAKIINGNGTFCIRIENEFNVERITLGVIVFAMHFDCVVRCLHKSHRFFSNVYQTL